MKLNVLKSFPCLLVMAAIVIGVETPAAGQDAPAPEATYEEQVEALEALGYLGGSVAPSSDRGIRLHIPEKTQDGLNFFTSGHLPGAVLMDMDGRVIHEWRHEAKAAWPDVRISDRNPKIHFWRNAYLYPNGDVLGIFEGIGILKLDKQSNLLWARDNGAHHDLEVLPDGNIWVLTRETNLVPDIDMRRPTLEDFAILLSRKGEVIKRISLVNAARISGDIGKVVWDNMQAYGDVLHANSIKQLDRTLAPESPFQEGSLLLSMLMPHSVAVLEPDSGKFTWSQCGPWGRQHHARISSNGMLRVFDNRGTADFSAVVEMDPESRKITWEFRGSESLPFYTRTCGAAHELPNGNLLLVESDSGRVIEITRKGEKVWEFVNPNTGAETEGLIAAIYDMVRVPESYTAFMEASNPVAPSTQ